MTNSYTYDENYISTYEQKAPQYDSMYHDLINATRYQKVAENTYAMMRKENVATITCVGDMLCEEKLYKAHCDGENAHFHDVFQFVRPIFKKSDLVIGNLETCVVKDAPYTGEQYKIEGRFHNNAPQAFLDAIREAGFDFLIMANNHSLDCGLRGALETISRVEDAGMMRTGLFRPEETAHYTIAEVNGIRVGVLAYSTWFNRLQDNLTEEGKEKILSIYSPERAQTDIAAAKAAGAEFVLVYMHWGVDAEYKSAPSNSMKQMAQEVADAGADYIVGAHPHALMPFGIIAAKDGRRVPLIYSMGNFVTSELRKISRETGILQLSLEKKDGRVTVLEESFIPCYVPDSFCGIGYPVVPEKHLGIPAATAEALSASHSHARRVVGQGKCNQTATTDLTTVEICDILGVSTPLPNELYTTVNFAEDARKGGVAIVSAITSNPSYITPDARQEKLAQLAMEKGAKLLITTKQIKDYPCLIVDNVFAAYTKLMTTVRNRFDPKTISITGSIGKTTATEMVYTVISNKYKTHRNTGSANSVRYAGTVIQQLKPEHTHYVQETMEGPPYGAASTIAKMVQPQAAVVTVVGTSHLEAFGSQERILESCLGVQDGMPEDGLLILNGDDPFQWKAETRCKAVYYAIDNPEADYVATNIRGEGETLLFDLKYEDKSVTIRLHCFGKHNVLDATAAFIAGKWAGMTDKEIVSALDKYRTSGIRQNLVQYGGYRLFLDCYNAAPESVKSALDALSMVERTKDGHYIGVLADILEVGDEAENIHRSVGRMAADSCLDLLICYGKDAKFIAEEAKANPSLPIYYTTDVNELVSLLKELVTHDDVVLFKGSHGMALEHVVDKIWGTWFHEEFERYDFLTRVKNDDNLRYRIYPDHVTVETKRSTLADLVIPDTVEDLPVTGIEKSAFSGTSYTQSVTFPKGLVNVRYCSFYKAKNITEITLPDSVRIIEKSAFSTCEKLRTVVIGEGCTHIGYRAFGNCPNLERVEIPATVMQIGAEAFLNCKKLAIHGIKDSYAHRYATAHNIRFVAKDAPNNIIQKILFQRNP